MWRWSENLSRPRKVIELLVQDYTGDMPQCQTRDIDPESLKTFRFKLFSFDFSFISSV
jgi:hypothetical protein